jgi:hypothetical protein
MKQPFDKALMARQVVKRGARRIEANGAIVLE